MCVATHPTGQGPRAVSEPTCLRRDAASVIFNLPKYHVIDAPSHHNRGGSDSDPEPHRDGVPGRTEAKPARECDEQPGQRRQPSRSALNTHIYPEGRCGAGRRLACDEIPRLVALCWPILDAGGQSARPRRHRRRAGRLPPDRLDIARGPPDLHPRRSLRSAPAQRFRASLPRRRSASPRWRRGSSGRRRSVRCAASWRRALRSRRRRGSAGAGW